MSRINLEQPIKDAIIVMAEGNPGAMTTCVELLKNGGEIDPQGQNGVLFLLSLDSLEIYGSRIYMLWNDVCQRSLLHTCAVLRGWQLGLLTSKEINLAIDNWGEGLDKELILSQIQERLTQFGRNSHE